MGAVDRMMRYGSRLAWFVGSLSTVNAVGFGDMRVSLPLVIVIIFIYLFQLFQYHPKASAFQSIIDKFQLTEEPLIESAFYADLTLRSILAVDQMKKGCSYCQSVGHLVTPGFCSDGSWPTMDYTRCSNFTGQPIVRDLNLKSVLTKTEVKSSDNKC